MGGLGGSDEEGVMGGLQSRGDSGGGVSQPISDTGEPFLTYGVASRMYFTERKRKREISSIRLRHRLLIHSFYSVNKNCNPSPVFTQKYYAVNLVLLYA